MQKKSLFVDYQCKRCGAKTIGLRKSITGATFALEKFKGICTRCSTPQERDEILKAQAGCLSRLVINNWEKVQKEKEEIIK